MYTKLPNGIGNMYLFFEFSIMTGMNFEDISTTTEEDANPY